ncbi:putative beta-fructofuranosidase [Helianthus annuus]|nr:putative beta-fructofuranosidase [Helianthus annuus]
MTSQTSSDVENPTHAPLLDDDYGYVPSLDASDQPSQPQETNRQPSKPVLLLISGLLAIGLLVALIVGNVRIETHDNDAPLPERRDPIEQGVSEKSFGLPPNVSSFSWTDDMLSWQMPAFHFTPGKNWMNDPNGPVFYKGWYHLFYQYSPAAPVWGLIVWGHAVSRDMVHWRHLPIAMETDKWYDVNGVWTGSTTILPNNELVVLYTGSTNESVQVQNLAYPANPSDPLLVNWVKDPANPVLVPPKWINIKDFRDPTTAWLTPEGRWRMVIGTKVNRTGIAILYDTDDFKSYDLLDTKLHQVDGTGMWECVDFFPVSKNESGGLDTGVIGPGIKHVLKASMDDDRCDYYAIGDYNPKKGTWVPDNPKIDVGIGLRYDYGIYYASKTFYDQNKERRILWSWIKETDSESSDIKKGWASLMAVPRTVALDPLTGSNLLQWPIEELENIRSNLNEFNEVKLEPGSLVPLNVGPTSQLDIMVEFELDKKLTDNLQPLRAGSVPYNCAGHGGAGVRDALGPFGVLVLANKNLTEHTPAYFYIVKGKKGELDTFFCIDQSRSSIAKDVDKSIYGSTVPVLEGEKLSMRILVDHSIVEGYAQGGRSCITSRVYPTEAINDDAQIFLFNNATSITVTASLKTWQMGVSSTNGSGWVWIGPSLILVVVFFFVVWTWQNQRNNRS